MGLITCIPIRQILNPIFVFICPVLWAQPCDIVNFLFPLHVSWGTNLLIILLLFLFALYIFYTVLFRVSSRFELKVGHSTTFLAIKCTLNYTMKVIKGASKNWALFWKIKRLQNCRNQRIKYVFLLWPFKEKL